MCARIFYLLLAALFVFLVVTVAAFRYLEWWQALSVSAFTFTLLVLGGRWLVRHYVRRTVGRVGEMAKELFGTKSRVLRGATADVHVVRPTTPRTGEPSDLRWYEVEATIFRDPAESGPRDWWDVTDLRLVPASTPPPSPFNPRDGDEFELHDLVLVRNGEPVIPVDGQASGPERLRFTAGVPRDVRELTFRYHFEQFGLVRVPLALPGSPTP